MKLKAYFLALFILLCATVQAAVTEINIGGKVYDAKSHETLPGATVSLPELRL